MKKQLTIVMTMIVEADQCIGDNLFDFQRGLCESRIKWEERIFEDVFLESIMTDKQFKDRYEECK